MKIKTIKVILLIVAGLEPAIFGLEVRRLIHQATRPMILTINYIQVIDFIIIIDTTNLITLYASRDD